MQHYFISDIITEAEMNLIFHPSNSILAEKGSFCLQQRCFPTAPGFQIYCDLNKKKLRKDLLGDRVNTF